jgi:glycine/D-amino acid oxidase-like deaminating enzyme/nitrite reductase/ring-hydroxylating ferredoxin subunit
MKRDGACTSLWQDTVDTYSEDKKDIRDLSFDVIIAGGGITGITTALLLQKAGKSVLIAEAKSIGFGTTGGTTAHLNTFLDTPYYTIQSKFNDSKAQLTAKAVQDALDLIKQNVTKYGIDCGYKELSGYLFSQDQKQSEELEDIIKSAQECQVKCSWTKAIPVPIPFQKAIEFPGQATFHPLRYVTALAEIFENAGGIILENCRVQDVTEGDPHVIQTSRGNFKTEHFIYATHIPPGVNLLHFRCAPYRSYAIAVKLDKSTDYPDSLVYDMYDPYHYYRTQEIDGELYFIAGGEDHKTGHEENTSACFTRLEAYVRQFFPVRSVTHRWSSQYFEPNDGIPYIGHLPAHPDKIYVATGYGGNGMIYSAVAAITLTDMIVTGSSEYQDLFNPNRIKIVAGFSNFVKESADVVGKLIGTIMPADKLEELADLAPGEAKVMKYEGHRLAIYKDENGTVYPLNSACTHIKCEVAWNTAEKSWDCPCHGSRFSYTGEMLTAPARKDLEFIRIERVGSQKSEAGSRK